MIERELSERSEQAPALFESGTVFGRYEIVRCVGVGGMAVVYEAVHSLLKKSVALKVLHPRLRSSDASRGRFLREAEIAARVRHPNVVDITDVGLEQGVCFLVMEFLEGEALASVLEREGPLEVARAMDIIVPVAAGLAAVHSEGIIHRDLKPENVILATSAGGIVPKIVDFGVSKDLLSSAGSSHTVAGTPTHMAPEQARGGAVDGRADEYSLALIAYQCLTGTLPYQAGSLLELMQLIELGEYRCIRELRPQVPVNLELVIQRAMMSVAEARFPTIVDFGSALLPFASPVVVSRYAYELNKTGNDPDREVSPPQGAVQSLPGEQAKNVSDREPDVRAVAPITPQSLSRAGANAFKSDRMIRRTLIGSFVLLALAAIAVASYLRRHREGGTVRPAGRAEERISSEQHVSSVTVFPQASGLPQGGSRAVASRAVPTPSSPPANPKKTRQSTKQGTASATDLGINLTRSGQPSNATSE